MFKIAICAGHGFNTAGKRTPDGEREWSFNNKLAIAFTNTMSQYDGVTVKRFDDPTGKTDVPLATRTNGANAWGADIYISFHHNANTAKWGTWTGVETFYFAGSVKGKKLAEAVHPAIVAAYGLKNRGLKTTNLHITRETKMPAVLIEGGFMDSTIDIKKLRDDKVLKNAGEGVAKAVAVYAGLKKKVVVTPAPAAPVANTISGSTYTVVKGDTLWGISQKVKLTVAEIKSLNNLKSDVLSIGQVLKLKETPVAPVAPTVVKETVIPKVSEQKSVLFTSTEINNKKFASVVISGKGYVSAVDVAELMGLKAVYDTTKKEIIFVKK